MKSIFCRKRHRRLAIVDNPLVAAARFTAVLVIEFAHDPSPLEANTPLRLQVTRLGKETVYSRDQEKIRTNYFCKSLQVNHAAVMKFRHRNSISSAAGDRALGPCSLRNQEKDYDDHFKNGPDHRDRGGGHRIAGIGPVVRSRSWQRQCGGVQLCT